MSAGAPQTLRSPLIVLAVADLAILGQRLWPWQEVLNLPGNGTVGIDPAVTLIGYIGLIIWINNYSGDETRKALSNGAMLGLLGGFMLVAEVMLSGHPGLDTGWLQLMLLLAAAILWGVAGLLAARKSGGAGHAALPAIYSGMVSCLMGCMAALLMVSLNAPTAADAQNAWKQYEGLAIGDVETQALVHSLNTATAFLLVGPLVGCGLGLIFGFFGQTQKN